MLFVLVAIAGNMTAQPERPKLVVGLVVDQMRWDYLYRYADRYCDGGLKRLLGEGYSYENALIPYIPSVTAIGHSSIYTGSVPSIHGIAGNIFMKEGQVVYCCDDKTVKPVGSDGKAGLMSPRNLQVTTVGDELKLATNNRSKTIGVALKDRASILPAGRNADGAYWYDGESGSFITSTYYMDKLPTWASDFNKRKLADKYLSTDWTTLYPIDTYRQSTVDETPYEKGIKKGEKATLPLDLKTLKKKYGYDVLRATPFGNDITLDMAKAAVEGENLGNRGETDFLAISCSSTDVIGHQVGIRAVEIEDTYLRLDKAIASFLAFLDEKVGRGNYLIFLSADHGGADNPKYMLDNRIDAGIVNYDEVKQDIESTLKKKYPNTNGLVKTVMNYQVFFDTQLIDSLGLDYDAIKATTVDALKRNAKVLYACDMEKASVASIPDNIKKRIINGYNRERSGGVQIIMKPGYSDGDMKGTTHGLWNPYDTHIPCVFMGWGIEHGASAQETYMTDIAPTIAAMLHIQAPSGCVGRALPIADKTLNR